MTEEEALRASKRALAAAEAACLLGQVDAERRYLLEAQRLLKVAQVASR